MIKKSLLVVLLAVVGVVVAAEVWGDDPQPTYGKTAGSDFDISIPDVLPPFIPADTSVKIDFGISVHDGTDPNVPPYVSIGDPCIYPEWGRHQNGIPFIGLRINGWATLSTPPWKAAHWKMHAIPDGIKVTKSDGTVLLPGMTSIDVSVMEKWQGPCLVYWTLLVDHGWEGGWNLPAGLVEQKIVFSTMTPLSKKTPFSAPEWVPVARKTFELFW